MDYRDYFEFRQVKSSDYTGFTLPAYLSKLIQAVPDPRVLDFGCGFGQMLNALRLAGVTNADGLDIEPEAIKFCKAQGIRCTDSLANPEFFQEHCGYYDFIIMSHVLEHFPKEQMIDQLKKLKLLLKPGGALIVMVPNAQANTGAYWAFEDFTHYFLFTSGSLYYVLRAAGYHSVEFLDVDCTAGTDAWKRPLLKALLWIYTANYRFWNRVTNSPVHRPSPLIFSFEIKALARAGQ
jgi:SAM-dependent methyltransferase